MTREDQIKQAAIDRYGNNGDESQYMLGKIQAFIVGARYADSHPTESIIKWQTGEPKEEGRYLITTINGCIATAVLIENDLHDKWFFKTYVKAWCKLSNIEPYKEETKDINCVDCAHLYGYNNEPVCSYFNEVNPFVTARCREAFKRRREGMKIVKAKIRNGRLQCHVCVHWKNCNEVNTECVANFIHNNIVVHLVEKERKEEQP